MRAAGHTLGKLHGVPVAIKDIFDYAGHSTSAGSNALTDRHPTVSANAVVRLEAAGMIVLGKTNMVEFAFGGWGTNPVKGTPVNPWGVDDRIVPGGSSSGSAVAIAAGLVPAALGTDTGGSIRTPAAWCGIVGLKTSRGLVGRGGVVPLCPTHDTVGPMARSVRDAALMMETIAGPDDHDPETSESPSVDFINGIEDGIEGFRFGVLGEGDMSGMNAEVRAAFDNAVNEVVQLGGDVEEIRLPLPIESYLTGGGDIMSVEAYLHLGRYVEEHLDLVDPVIRERILRGKDISGERYENVLEERRQAQVLFHDSIRGMDAILLPGSHRNPPPLRDVDENEPPNHFGRIVNFLDLAALTVPIGRTASRLPTGIQIAVRRFEDARALRIGRALEKTNANNFDAESAQVSGLSS